MRDTQAKWPTLVGRAGSLTALLASSLAVLLTVMPAVVGERFAADAIYLPLREILPAGEQRHRVEESIIATTSALNAGRSRAEWIVGLIGCAGAAAACYVLWRGGPDSVPVPEAVDRLDR